MGNRCFGKEVPDREVPGRIACITIFYQQGASPLQHVVCAIYIEGREAATILFDKRETEYSQKWTELEFSDYSAFFR